MDSSGEGVLIEMFKNYSSSDLEKLDPQLKHRIEHARLHEKHKGHEEMHTLMLVIFFTGVIFGQVVLMQWKKRHFKSYQRATLFWMWFIPLVISVARQWWRFVTAWSLYSLITMLVMSKTRQKQISGSTPRLVYKWFLLLHQFGYIFGAVGYVIILASLIGLADFLNTSPETLFDAALMFVFYGTYFSLLSRDFAEICTNTMAAHIGYFSSDGLPSRTLDEGVCAVCGGTVSLANGGSTENSYRLNCGHVFHEFCIRGWCIVGKNQICPYCREKVDLNAMFSHHWEKKDLLYGQMLDFFRYLVAWQPLIIVFVHRVNLLLGLE